MKFNGNKFKHLWYGKSFDDETKSMVPEGFENEKQQSTRDLRVNMSSCSDFDEHIQSVTSKGEQIAGWILRTFHTRDENAMRTISKLMVIPKMDYIVNCGRP